MDFSVVWLDVCGGLGAWLIDPLLELMMPFEGAVREWSVLSIGEGGGRLLDSLIWRGVSRLHSFS